MTEDNEYTTEELTQVGTRINDAYEFIQNTLSQEDLEAFLAYCGNLEALGPLINPTAFLGTGAFGQIDKARDRARTLLEIVTEGHE